MALHVDKMLGGPLTWPDPDLVRDAQAALFDGGLVMVVGSTGPGKTLFAVEMIAEFTLGRMREARYYIWPELYPVLCSKKWSSSTGTTSAEDRKLRVEAASACRRVDLLVLDEIKEDATKADVKELELIIDHRYTRKMATLLISNITDEAEIRDRIGTRSMDRIEERGHLFEFDWPSFRVAKGRRRKGAA